MYFLEQQENENAERKFLETCDETKVNFFFLRAKKPQKIRIAEEAENRNI